MKAVFALAMGAALATTVGCSRAAPKAPSLDDAPTESVEASSASTAVDRAIDENQGGGLVLSDEVRRLCPGVAPPEFGFDSALVRSQWRATLQGLAECMKTGGLSGKRVLLTGHTDPRGDDDYNMTLGGRRAGAVRSAVEAFGVPTARVGVTSRGKVDAAGTDEKGWQRDRRVDIDVAKS